MKIKYFVIWAFFLSCQISFSADYPIVSKKDFMDTFSDFYRLDMAFGGCHVGGGIGIFQKEISKKPELLENFILDTENWRFSRGSALYLLKQMCKKGEYPKEKFYHLISSFIRKVNFDSPALRIVSPHFPKREEIFTPSFISILWGFIRNPYPTPARVLKKNFLDMIKGIPHSKKILLALEKWEGEKPVTKEQIDHLFQEIKGENNLSPFSKHVLEELTKRFLNTIN